MLRGLLWLGGGLIVLAGALVVTAPELIQADAAATAGLAGVVLGAGLPGALLVAVVAWRRRGVDPARREAADDDRCVPTRPHTRSAP